MFPYGDIIYMIILIKRILEIKPRKQSHPPINNFSWQRIRSIRG